MGRYWHPGDDKDQAKIKLKFNLCSRNGIILLVVWAIANRPSWEEQLAACQKAIDDAGLSVRLELPPISVRDQLAKAVPKAIRDQLVAMNHDALEYELNGNIRSLCRVSGKLCSPAPTR